MRFKHKITYINIVAVYSIWNSSATSNCFGNLKCMSTFSNEHTQKLITEFQCYRGSLYSYSS